MTCILKNLWLLPFLSVTWWGCSENKTDDSELLPTVVVQASQILPFDQAATEVSFIALRIPENQAINLSCRFSELTVYGNELYFVTKCMNQFAIHVFDWEGNYRRSYEKQGDGPEEYAWLQGLYIKDDTLTLSAGKGELVQYRLPDFRFLRRIEVGSYLFLNNFRALGSDTWLLSGEYDGTLDADGKYPVFVKKDVQSEKSEGIGLLGTPVSAEISEGEIADFGQGYLLNYAFSDTIFHFSNGKAEPIVRMHYGDRHPPTTAIYLEEEAFFESLQTQRMAFNMGNIGHTDGTCRVRVFGLEKKASFDLDDAASFPIYEVFFSIDSPEPVAIPMLGALNAKGTFHAGYFFDTLQPEDWVRALETGSLGSHGESLQQVVSRDSDFEEPVIIRYQVRTNGR
ncbi:MAG: 6-bladed beta-propeller [Lunatimonas sp.]|uniref:6-bladed beta-propeller n=1 Tax=Lunatimonas sp. TaxID=2060141 RepID=UPI00263B1678|nr:6-bladed beta-propeller [Lunatimonas sp.]MCC5939149.1 6-bladed beta-propeller [Lunatimonas sp.]